MVQVIQVTPRIDRYTIGDLLGAGATAEVYNADNAQGERFAIKVFYQDRYDFLHLQELLRWER